MSFLSAYRAFLFCLAHLAFCAVMTAKVVCEACNNTWMSDIENRHAKPTMTPLIKGDVKIPIRQSEARSLALYAFKTAVILDHTQRDREPFFSRRIRQAFRNGLDIPQSVRMWMGAYLPGDLRVNYDVGYWNGNIAPAYPVQQFVLTCGIGCFAFQVVAVKQMRSIKLNPLLGFEDLAIPFWPNLIKSFVWPAREACGAVRSFSSFTNGGTWWMGSFRGSAR
jgi:hypothetical protein